MTTRKLDKKEWQTFFDGVTGMLEGKQAEIEVASLRLGDQVAAAWLPLIGITYDPKDDIVEVALEGGWRFDLRALAESILEPSKVVDPKYHTTVWVLTTGQVLTGRSGQVSGKEITVELNPVTGETVKIARAEIESSHPSDVSPMPSGLLDTLTLETFTPHVGGAFRLSTPDGIALTLTLDEAQSLASPGTRAEGTRRKREPCEVGIFRQHRAMGFRRRQMGSYRCGKGGHT